MKLEDIKKLKIKIVYKNGSFDEVEYDDHTFLEISTQNEIGSQPNTDMFTEKNMPTGQQRLTFLMINNKMQKKFHES